MSIAALASGRPSSHTPRSRRNAERQYGFVSERAASPASARAFEEEPTYNKIREPVPATNATNPVPEINLEDAVPVNNVGGVTTVNLTDMLSDGAHRMDFDRESLATASTVGTSRTTRKNIKRIDVSAKVENLKRAVAAAAKRKKRTLKSKDRLVRRKKDLEEHLQKAIVIEAFKEAIASEKAMESARSSELLSGRSTARSRGRVAQHMRSQIAFGDDARTPSPARSGARSLLRRRKPPKTARSASSRTIVAAKGYRTVQNKAPRPIKLSCFVLALKQFVQTGDQPLTHGEAHNLWRACGGDYMSFVQGMYPKKVGPTVTKFGFTKDNSQPKQALVMDGPFDRQGKGERGVLLNSIKMAQRINYRYCRTTVQMPSGFNKKLVQRSATLPAGKLNLEYVYGFSGQKHYCRGNSLYWTLAGELVYFVAGVGVVLDTVNNKQRFFKKHTDDITCMALDPYRRLVATGQMGKGIGVRVWDVQNCEQVRQLGFEGLAGPNGVNQPKRFYERWICAVAFTFDSMKVVAVGADNHHTLAVWDIATGKLLVKARAQTGAPPQIYDLVCGGSKEHPDDHKFITVGQKHTRFWTFEERKNTIASKVARFRAHPQPREMMSACFMPSGRALTCGSNGFVYLWWNAECITSFAAHAHGPCHAVRPTATGFVSAGQDGKVRSWVQVGDARRNAGQFSPGTEVDLLNFVQQRESKKTKSTIIAHPESIQVQVYHNHSRVGGGRRIGSQTGRAHLGGSPRSTVSSMVGKQHRPRDPLAILKQRRIARSSGTSLALPIRSLAVTEGNDSPFGNIAVATGTSQIWAMDCNGGRPTELMSAHYGDLYGLSPHPRRLGIFATVGDMDRQLCLWDGLARKQLRKRQFEQQARSCAIAPNGRDIAVGFKNGMVAVVEFATMTDVFRWHDCTEAVEEMKYSPNGAFLATGSRDNNIDVYSVTNDYQHYKRLHGHCSFITHLDWSVDSRLLQSTCGAYELIYWDVASGKMLRSLDDKVESDVEWYTFTLTLGFPMMGIWPNYSDGSDINAAHRSRAGNHLVTADDHGKIKMFNAPCVVEDAPFKTYSGHSSHVMNVRFLKDDTHVVSVGGKDRAVFQWKYTPTISATEKNLRLGLKRIVKQPHLNHQVRII